MSWEKRRLSRRGTGQVTQYRRGCKRSDGGLLSTSTSGGQEEVGLIYNKKDIMYRKNSLKPPGTEIKW